MTGGMETPTTVAGTASRSAGRDRRGEVVVVTGMTGAGRSTAAKELEDLGYYVVDNMPPQLVTDVVRLVDESRGAMQPIAVVVDVRSGSFFSGLQEVLARGTTGRRRTLLFLEANDDVLVRRQEAARRPHPLQEGGRLLDGLRRERIALADLRADADLVIDTSGLNVHQLTDKVAEAFGTQHSTSLQATIVSFGFKYGIPVDADLVADMRFLPNPHWVPELRPLSGRDEQVASYVKNRPEAQMFLDQYVPLLETVSAGYLKEGKRFMTVAIGCTGGKHRSVAMTEEIASRLRALGLAARPVHPDLGRGGGDPRRAARVVRRCPGGRARWRPRARRVSGGTATGGQGAHRCGHRRRQRRLVGTAATRVRCAAPGGPAPGVVRAVRGRRLGTHVGTGSPASVRERGRDARPRSRQPADRHAVGTAR